MKFAKLIMITANNNNKEYIMTQVDSSTFKVDYGRVGSSYRTVTYSMYEWDSKYRSKIAKGYKDVTELVEKTDLNGDSIRLPYDYISDKSIRDILNRLYSYTDKYLKENYLMNVNDVSQAQIDKAYEIIDKLEKLAYSKNLDVREVNDQLIKLFETIPRRMKNVKENLVDNGATRDKIDEKIRAELDMLKTMSDAVNLRKKKQAENKKLNEQVKDLTLDEQSTKTLEELGLIVENVTDEDIKFIKKQLGESAHLFKNAWKITNPRTEKAFNDLLETPEYKGSKIAHYWHGSRNQNWYNIIQTGLVTNPKGVKITGKMFGYGIYFAPKAKKSVNYTSLEGSYWAGGDDKSGFMALFDVALGNVLDVYEHYHWCSRTNKEEMWKHNKCHTLYAHEGRGFLYNDEVIAYDDAQVNIKYIVEISR